MVDVAKACGADAVSHGCTGKGNYQVSTHTELHTNCRIILAHHVGAVTCDDVDL